jgi:hypothetical protein
VSERDGRRPRLAASECDIFELVEIRLRIKRTGPRIRPDRAGARARLVSRRTRRSAAPMRRGVDRVIRSR